MKNQIRTIIKELEQIKLKLEKDEADIYVDTGRVIDLTSAIESIIENLVALLEQ